jgi:small subunit ribosomal protein S19
MSRSIWKHNYIGKILPFEIKKKKKWENTWNRKVLITPKLIGYNFNVYNGIKSISSKITEDMVQHKLGEFAPTRKKYVSKLSKKNLLKKR